MLNRDLLTKSRLFSALEPTMLRYQLAYLNGDVFKRRTRRRRPSEDDKIYTDVVEHTAALPIARYVVDTINDVVFEPGVVRDLYFVSETGQTLATPTQEWSTLMLLDADLNNNTLDGVMEQVGDLTSIFGHCWVFVDMPRAQEGAGRPYVVPVSPLNVWDYDFTSVRGVQIPRYVKVLELETADCYYFKVFHLGTTREPTRWECWEVEKGAPSENPARMLDMGTYPLGMGIPGFIAYGRRDPRRHDIGISDIDVAADVQAEHYKLECEAYQALQFARTLIRADNGIKIPAHAGAIVRATAGQVESITVNTQDVDAIVKKQTDLLMNYENLTGLGGLRRSSLQAQSGISIIEERRQLHRMAKAKARLMEIAEESIWTYASRFMGVRWAGEVSYKTDYENHDTAFRLALFTEAQRLVPQNPVIDGVIAQQVLGWLVSDDVREQYLTALESTAGNTMIFLQAAQSQAVSRDLQEQTPTEQESPEPTAQSTILGGTGTSITYTGQSYYTQDAVAEQLTQVLVGR